MGTARRMARAGRGGCCNVHHAGFPDACSEPAVRCAHASLRWRARTSAAPPARPCPPTRRLPLRAPPPPAAACRVASAGGWRAARPAARSGCSGLPPGASSRRAARQTAARARPRRRARARVDRARGWPCSAASRSSSSGSPCGRPRPRRESIRHARDLAPSTVVATDGRTIATFARAGRTWTPLADISPAVVAALLATEDRRFYQHGGLDLRRTIGAVLRTIGGTTQGGSTLTQQLARNLYPERIGRSRSLIRKVKEAITAWTHRVRLHQGRDSRGVPQLGPVPLQRRRRGPRGADLFRRPGGPPRHAPGRPPRRRAERDGVVQPGPAPRGGAAAARRGSGEPRHGRRDDARPGPRARRASARAALRAPERCPATARRTLSRPCGSRPRRGPRAEGLNLYGDGLTIHTTLDLRMQEAAIAAVVSAGDALQDVADVEWGRASRAPARHDDRRLLGRPPRDGPVLALLATTRRDLVDAFVRESAAFQTATDAGVDARARARQPPRGRPVPRRRSGPPRRASRPASSPSTPRPAACSRTSAAATRGAAPFDHVASARRQPGLARSSRSSTPARSRRASGPTTRSPTSPSR